MKIQLTILFSIIALFAFASTEEIPDTIRVGKLKTAYYRSGKNENVFKNVAIATISDNYLKKILSEDKYNSLPVIELDLNYMKNYLGEEKMDVAMTNSTIILEIWGSENYASKTLKLLDYTIQNYKEINKRFDLDADIGEYNYIDELINDSDIVQIKKSIINEKMRECLETSYYRTPGDRFPKMDRISSEIKIYEFKNDTFNFYCRNERILSLKI